MNSILLAIGIAIALALTVAFAAPFFIDWSAYRSYFEARASEIVGREVVFAGDLDVRLVPFPRLEATDVRIGGRETGETVDAVEIHAALTPLLSGELQITEMVLRRPFAVLGLDESGRILWDGKGGPRVPMAPEQVRIDRFEIVDGAFDIDDARSASTFRLTAVNIAGSATSLVGPFRAEGGLVAEGRRLTIRLATGRLQDERGGIRIKLSVLPADLPLTVDIDGILVRDGADVPVYSGTVVVERPAADDSGTPWRLDGLATATPEQIVVDKASLRVGPETQSVTFAGAANVALGARPGFDAVLSARQLDLDRLLGSGTEAPVNARTVVSRLGETLDPDLFPIPGRLALDVDSIVLSGGLVEALSMDIGIDGRTWTIERAVAAAPGGTDIAVAGGLAFEGDAPVFSGAVRVNAAQSTVFGDWLLGPDIRLPGLGGPASRLDAAATLRLGGGELVAEEIDIGTADARLAGSVGFRPPGPDGRGLLSADLTADRFALAAGAGQGAFDRARILSAAEAILEGVDVDLLLRADTLSAGEVEARQVVVEAAVSDGDIRIDRLAAGDIGGARIEGGGAVRDFARNPDGALSLSVAAESLDGVAGFLATLGFGKTGDWLAARAGDLVPTRIQADVQAAQVPEGSRVRLTLSGAAGGSDIHAELEFDGEVDRPHAAAVRILLEARNPDGMRLARQAGLMPGPGAGGAGSLAFSAEGRPDAAMTFALEAAGLGVDGDVTGQGRWPQTGGREVTADVDLAIAVPGDLLAIGGILLPAGLEPLTLKAALSVTDDIWTLSSLEATSGTAAATGRLSVDTGGAQSVVDGDLEVSRVDIPWLAGLMLGPEAVVADAVAGGERGWATAAFSPAVRTGWRGRIGLSAPAAVLFDGATVTDARMTFGFDPGLVSIERLTGNMFGGQFVGGIDISEIDGMTALSGRFELSGARLEEIVWSDGARPVATGSLSAGADFQGAGRSALALVSALSGTGSFRVEDGVVRRLNPSAFDQIVGAADAGLELTEDRVREVFSGHLDSGSLSFDVMEGAFAISSGVLRASNIRIDSDALGSFASATVDLAQLAIDSEWTLRVGGGADSRVREVAVVFAGPLAEPERRIDVNPLLGYLTVRAFERDVERLEALQAEILERQRLGRELLRQGQERVRRERDAAARAEEEARNAEEAERQQVEEEARRAEEEARRLEERRIEEERRRQAEEAPQAPEPPAGPDQRGSLQDPAPQPSAVPAATGLDDGQFRRRIEDILREIPSARDAPQPSGGVMAREPPPLGQPIVILPQPAVPVGPAATRPPAPQPRTTVQPDLDAEQRRTFR